MILVCLGLMQIDLLRPETVCAACETYFVVQHRSAQVKLLLRRRIWFVHPCEMLGASSLRIICELMKHPGEYVGPCTFVLWQRFARCWDGHHALMSDTGLTTICGCVTHSSNATGGFVHAVGLCTLSARDWGIWDYSQNADGRLLCL